MPISAVLVGARGTGGGNTATTTAGDTTASGSTFAALCSWDSSATSPGVTDSKGNTYTAVGTPQVDGNSAGRLQWWVCQDGTGGASHSATFTTTGTSYPTIHLIEITGAEAASLDQNAQTRDTSSPFTVTSPTLSQADELILCGLACNQANPFAPSCSNMTIISTETDVSNYWTSSVAETTVAATTAFTPSWTATGDTNGGLALVTFKESSGASPTLDQFGFRWRLDDGSETTATWAAAQNAAP